MGIAISEDHRDLESGVRKVLDSMGGVSLARAVLEAKEESLPPFWNGLAELGWLGMHLPERYGGGGYGIAELAIVVEAMARVVTPGPFLSSVLAAALIVREGSETLKNELLPGLADGSMRAGVGLSTSVEWISDGVLLGDAGHMLSGGLARWIVLVVGKDVVVAAGDAPGLQIQAEKSLDLTRPVVRIRCDHVRIPEEQILRGAASTLRRLGTVLAAAEAAGGTQACQDMATAYALERKQFGRLIGSFQAVKHHLANMLCVSELGTAAAWDAARAVDDDEEGPLAVAVAGMQALSGFVKCAKLNIQVHGGIGFTWEHDAHLYLRRATSLRALLGSEENYADEVARQVQSGATRTLAIELPAGAEQYREEVKAFLADYKATPEKDRAKRLAESGYLFPHWPKPWGRDASSIEQLVIDEDLKGIERPDMALASWILPTIIAHGTDEQRRVHVETTLQGKHKWCQLFSEPGAGSDLASLRTRAEKVEGGWKINGQKVWTSNAQFCDRGLLIARSDPSAPKKHDGLACFVIDMHAAGVDVRPLREITGEALFNEVFFDELFVPDEYLIGDPKGGWKAARTTLGNERVEIASIGGSGLSQTMGQMMGPREVLELLEAHLGEDTSLRWRTGRLLAEEQALGPAFLARGGTRGRRCRARSGEQCPQARIKRARPAHRRSGDGGVGPRSRDESGREFRLAPCLLDCPLYDDRRRNFGSAAQRDRRANPGLAARTQFVVMPSQYGSGRRDVTRPGRGPFLRSPPLGREVQDARSPYRARPSPVLLVTWPSIDQPATRRLNALRTTAQQSFASWVGCSVMSVTQSLLSRSRSNHRHARSPAVGVLGTRRYRGRPEIPRRRARRTNSSTAWKPTESLSPSVSSACTLRAPYVSRNST